MSIEGALGEQRTAEIPAGTIVYRETGDPNGPPVLFLHGLLVNGDLWRGVAPRVAARGYRCLVPDWPLGSHARPMRPGADLSPHGLARIVADFVEATETGPVTLVANDTGGAIAQMVATRHPEHLARLVLTSCDCFENFLPPRYRPLQWAGRSPVGVWLAMQAFRLRAVQFSPIGFGPLVTRPIEPRIVESYLRSPRTDPAIRRDLAAVLVGIDARLTLEAARHLERFAAPALVVWGAEDRIFPLESGKRLASLLPNARFTTIAGSRAFVPEDQPERLAETLLGFLAETGSAGLRPASARH
jgi:pimeloyl-ACP methyl ester carboxylesterase